MGLLSEANLALGRLDGSIYTLPNPDMFVFMYVRREAVLSSQIEGTQSSLNDLLAAEAKIMNPNRPQDVPEVINYVDAMNYGLDRLQELPVSNRLIREIHARLLQGARGGNLTSGEFRRSQNWIGETDGSITDAIYVPPPPSLVAEQMGQLEAFVHADDALPLLVRIGLVHAQLETIHPFLDGNGRIGRLLITFLLTERDILRKPVLYLSHYFKRRRQEYYERLQAVRELGQWEEWLSFFLRGVQEVATDAADTARQILALREVNRIQITNGFGNSAGNGHRVLDHLFDDVIVSVADVQRMAGCGFPAANDLVRRFVTAGILREFTGNKRNRRFIYAPYVRLFSDGDAL